MAIFWEHIKGKTSTKTGKVTKIIFKDGTTATNGYPEIQVQDKSLGNIITTGGDTQTLTKGLEAPWITVNGLFKATQIQALYNKTNEDSIYANGSINGLSLKSRDGGTAELYNVNCYNNTVEGSYTDYSLNVHGTSHFTGQSSFEGAIEGSSGNFTGEIKGASGNFTGEVKGGSGIFTNISLNGKDLDTRLNDMGFKGPISDIGIPGAIGYQLGKFVIIDCSKINTATAESGKIKNLLYPNEKFTSTVAIISKVAAAYYFLTINKTGDYTIEFKETIAGIYGGDYQWGTKIGYSAYKEN